ncbi:MAG: DUF4192 domain-containing protein [Propionibacteriales bacterium]|nr:DUF4192 domain-containing protein [Propionibacteriales bacterium]
MSKTDRTIRRARDELHGVTPMIATIKDPADLVAMIPYVLGFMPNDSVVLIALRGPRRRFGPCLRLDLADNSDDAAAQARYLVDVVTAHSFTPVVIVAFSADAERAAALVEPLCDGLARRRVHVLEALRADGRRWWSYTCADEDCCGPAGSPYDAGSSRVAAQAVVAGLQKAPDRDSLRVQFEPTSPFAAGGRRGVRSPAPARSRQGAARSRRRRSRPSRGETPCCAR